MLLICIHIVRTLALLLTFVSVIRLLIILITFLVGFHKLPIRNVGLILILIRNALFGGKCIIDLELRNVLRSKLLFMGIKQNLMIKLIHN